MEKMTSIEKKKEVNNSSVDVATFSDNKDINSGNKEMEETKDINRDVSSTVEQNTDYLGSDGFEQTSPKELSEKIDSVIETKEYKHWNSPEEAKLNRIVIQDYDSKKRSVDLASLKMQRDILTKYPECFDRNNLERMHKEFGSNKTEIYNEAYFLAHKAPPDTRYSKVTGLREFPSGKVCVRDSSDVDRLKHTAAHETMHDLSYQSDNHMSNTLEREDGKLETKSKKELRSGIEIVDESMTIVDGNVESSEKYVYNKYLNEGITEMYTIETLQSRGEIPKFDSYTYEVGFALNIREKVGDELIAKAYFGGDISLLKSYIDQNSSIPDAWDKLNRYIDNFHKSGDVRYKIAADEIINSIEDDGNNIKVKVLSKGRTS